MNDAIITRICARPDHGIASEDVAIFRRMGTYLDRSSLKIVWDDGAPGRELVIHVSNDAQRFRFSLGELIDLWHGLRAGRPIDWSSLAEVERRSPDMTIGSPKAADP